MNQRIIQQKLVFHKIILENIDLRVTVQFLFRQN
jgi:hypothetical protein